GWLEIYNADRDADFRKYVDSIINAKMLEVCSTTLPQKVLPAILAHPEYSSFLAERVRRYERNANHVYETFKDMDGVIINRSDGTFYSTVLFEDGVIGDDQTLAIEDQQARRYIEELVSAPVAHDKRFAYYLLGGCGVCVVPLSSFTTGLQGFRMTLLETDEKKFCRMAVTIKSAVLEYLA
ncbi:MAG TPA: aminotransferase class I/II-fold pyridoxal phosphate-dependent enzyme, partial [Desulfobacteraceae bacterium]|nr:aminotransferase class I/II-fold pyridoxal phosphate-dependent enzyme [Desulfobacteraceae bacterium]